MSQGAVLQNSLIFRNKPSHILLAEPHCFSYRPDDSSSRLHAEMLPPPWRAPIPSPSALLWRKGRSLRHEFSFALDRPSSDPKNNLASGGGAMHSVLRAFGTGRKTGVSEYLARTPCGWPAAYRKGEKPHQPEVSLCLSQPTFSRDEAKYSSETRCGTCEYFSPFEVVRGQQSAPRGP